MSDVNIKSVEFLLELSQPTDEPDAAQTACGWAADEIKRLQTLVIAQQELIWAYEDELEPNNYDEEDLPVAIAEARRALDACKNPSGG